MKTKNSYQTQRVLSALALLATLTTSALTARAEDNRAPQVPDEIAVPVGNKVHFHGFAVGFQIYTWNGVSWGAAVPEATLGWQITIT